MPIADFSWDEDAGTFSNSAPLSDSEAATAQTNGTTVLAAGIVIGRAGTIARAGGPATYRVTPSPAPALGVLEGTIGANRTLGGTTEYRVDGNRGGRVWAPAALLAAP